MIKYLVFLVMLLSNILVHAEGVILSCFPQQPSCTNCPEHQTIFPVVNFSENTGELNIEAAESEIIQDKYLLSGNVELTSENLFLSANDVEISTTDNSILASGNVRFQDEAYLITSDFLSATKDNDDVIATATNANYQDYAAGLGGANGYTEIISKYPTSVLLTNATYSLCPVNKNDWIIDADQIELNIEKNRGVADNAFIKFFGVPILYTPKWSWVLSGRGSGFLTPNYSTYYESGKIDNDFSIRAPYYFNIAPDRDLLVAMTYLSSRGLVYEGKYRQLIPSVIKKPIPNDLFEVEVNFVPEDKITSLKRWLLKFNEELDLSKKTHFSAQYYRVSDINYFRDIARTNTNTATLNSFLKLDYEDPANNLTADIYTEEVQVVNDGSPGYFRALEASVFKNFSIGQNKVDNYNEIKNLKNEAPSHLSLNIHKIENPMPISTSLNLGLVSSKFVHDLGTKETGIRTHGTAGISRQINIKYPKITPSANVAITNYSLKTAPNINRTVFGSGLEIDFTFNNQSNLFGYEINNIVSPKITYSYKGKVVQGDIPIFDTTDKYDDILSFANLTSGERYTGLDRISNANDVTLSLSSSYGLVKKSEKDIDIPDILSLKIAQSFYTDDAVVSNTANTNYEARKSYSDIAASINVAVNKFQLSSEVQFNPDTSRIEKKGNTIRYTSAPKKFLSMSFIDDGSKEIEKLYGAYPVTDSIHIFGGLDKTTSTGVTNFETSGFAYESCCWAFRVAHFKEKRNIGYNYSTGMELVLTGLGSTQDPLNGKIENNIPGYKVKLK